MADTDLLNTPLIWINKYLQTKVEELAGFPRLPFFPSTPSTLDDLTNTFPASQDGVMCVYDRLMDRLDETAEEVNNWCSIRKVNLGTEESPNFINNVFYFHRFKVYQLEEARDIIDFGTARTYGGNKFIIEFDYHQMPVFDEYSKDIMMRSNWVPEGLPAGGKIVI